MRPLAEAPASWWQGIEGVATDFDDTVSTHGRGLLPVALHALHALAQAGVTVVIATGRPLGWAEVLMRTLPVRAVVAENGGAALLREGAHLVASFREPDAQRREDEMQRTLRAVARVERAFPELRRVTDYTLRVTDVALDIGESVRVPHAVVEAASAMLREDGVWAVASTVHLHASPAAPDKPAGLRRVLAALGCDAERLASHWLYVGDSPNDGAAFGAIAHSVGVANVGHWIGRIDALPAYVARGEGGEGFAEVADGLLAHRGTSA